MGLLESLADVAKEGNTKSDPSLDRRGIHSALILAKLDGTVSLIAAKVELVIPIGAKVTGRPTDSALTKGIDIAVRLHHHIKLAFVLLESGGKEGEKSIALCGRVGAEESSVNVDVEPALFVHGSVDTRHCGIAGIDLIHGIRVERKGGRDDFATTRHATILNDLPVVSRFVVIVFRDARKSRVRHTSTHFAVVGTDILDFKAKLVGHGHSPLFDGFIIAGIGRLSRIFLGAAFFFLFAFPLPCPFIIAKKGRPSRDFFEGGIFFDPPFFVSLRVGFQCKEDIGSDTLESVEAIGKGREIRNVFLRDHRGSSGIRDSSGGEKRGIATVPTVTVAILVARINAILAATTGSSEIPKLPADSRKVDIGASDIRVEEIRVFNPDTLRRGEKADMAEKGIELANDGAHARLRDIDIDVSQGDERGSLRAKRGKDIPGTHEIIARDIAHGAGIRAVGVHEIGEGGHASEGGGKVRHGSLSVVW